MKRRICLFVAFWGLVVLAQGLLNVEELVIEGRNVSSGRYPDADYAIIDNKITLEYRNDATHVCVDDTAVKILTEAGRKKQRVLREYYSKAYSTSKFTLIQVISPDGKVRNIDPQAVCKESIDQSQMGSNIYDPNHKVLSASIPGLNVNDIVRYVVRRDEYKVRMPGAFGEYYVLEYDAPIISTTIQVKTAPNLPLKHKRVLSPVKGTVIYDVKEQKDGSSLHTWKVANVPMAIPEPKMPKMYTCVQRLLLSNIEKWEDVSSWYWKLSEPHFKCSPEMEAKIQELTRGVTDDMEKAKRIFTFVSQEIRYMGETTETEAPGYEPHDAAVTFGKRHGVCRDKAALLTAMLRGAGIEAFPVLIHSGPKKDVEVPQPFFNHAITAIRTKDGQYRLLDSTDENTADWLPAYLDNKSYLVATPEGDTLRTSPVRPADENHAKIDIQCDVNADGALHGLVTIEFTGINDNAYRGSFAEWPEEERRNFFERVLKRTVPGGRVLSLEVRPENIRDVSKPFGVTLAFEAKDFVLVKDKHAYMTIPSFIGAFGIHNWLINDISLDKRRFPLVCSSTAAGDEILKMNVDSKWGDLSSVPAFESESDDGNYEWRRKAIFDGNLITCASRNAIKTMEFSPEQYLMLKLSSKTKEDDLDRVLVFSIGVERERMVPESDVIILDSKKDITLNDKNKYTLANTVKMKVCTYNGLKDYSELRLPFCPAIKNVRLEYAKVTNGNKVSELNLKELKVMDSGWTATAPRYPEMKMLVANFPSVQVGSIIEYKTVTEYNGDEPFGVLESFAGFEPVKSKSLSIKVPDGIEISVAKSQNGFLSNNKAENIKEIAQKNNGYTTYIWTAENQMPLKRERNLPPLRCIIPTVSVESCSWYDLVQRLQNEINAKDVPEGEQLTRLVKQLEVYEPMRKVRALKTYVSRNIRRAGPELFQVPLSCFSKAEATLKAGYGNDIDIAIIYYTALRMLKLKPEIVFVSTRRHSPDVEDIVFKHVSATLFTKALVHVKVDGLDVWLNDKDQYSELGCCSYENCLALYPDGRIRRIELDGRYSSRRDRKVIFDFSGIGNATVKVIERCQGSEYAIYKQMFAEMTPEERRRYFLGEITAFSPLAVPDGSMDSNFNEYPGFISYGAKLDDFLVADGDFLSACLANPFKGALSASEDERRLPYEGGLNLDKLRIAYELNYSKLDGYELFKAPFCDDYVLKCVKDAFKYKAKVKSDYALFEFGRHLSPFLVMPGEYGALLDFNWKNSNKPNNTIIFRKVKK